MVNMCFAPNCRSGLPPKNGQDLSKIPKKALFSALKDQQTFLTWKRVIQRKDRTFTKSSFLCEDHFAPSDILTHFNAAGSDIFPVSRQVKRLLFGAIPTQWPGLFNIYLIENASYCLF